MNDLLKIKVNLDKNSYSKLCEDIKLFNIIKNNGEINKNKFLNLLYKNYYEMFQDKIDLQTKKIKEILKEENINDELCLKISHELINSNISNAYQTSSITFTLDSSNTTIFMNMKINYSDSAYFRNLIYYYLLNPQYKREEIIYKDIVDNLNLAIKDNKIISFKNNENIINLRPYKIATTKEELYSYLIGILDNDKVMSINISKIKNLFITNDNFKFNQEQISLLDKNIELGVNFPFNELCDAVITLNNYGIKNYNKRYLHRPKVEKIVGNDYYFNCSIDQLYFYFIAFGDTFVVKKPVELAKRFYNKFKKAKNNFYNEYQKNIE